MFSETQKGVLDRLPIGNYQRLTGLRAAYERHGLRPGFLSRDPLHAKMPRQSHVDVLVQHAHALQCVTVIIQEVLARDALSANGREWLSEALVILEDMC